MGSRSRNQTQTWTLGVNKTTDAIHTTRHVDILRRYIFWCCAGNQSVDAVTSHQLPACHPRLIVVEQLDSAPANRIGILPHCRIPPCSGCRSADKIYWSQTFELKYRYHFIILTRIRGKIFSKVKFSPNWLNYQKFVHYQRLFLPLRYRQQITQRVSFRLHVSSMSPFKIGFNAALRSCLHIASKRS